MPQLSLCYAGPCTKLGCAAQGKEPAQHCISLPWAQGSGLGSFLDLAGDGTMLGREQKQVPSVEGSAGGCCWQGCCYQVGQGIWPGLGSSNRQRMEQGWGERMAPSCR